MTDLHFPSYTICILILHLGCCYPLTVIKKLKKENAYLFLTYIAHISLREKSAFYSLGGTKKSVSIKNLSQFRSYFPQESGVYRCLHFGDYHLHRTVPN